jgi:FkbM family methyltransferase
MPAVRKWFSDLLLHAPAPVRSLRSLPLVGGLIHRVSHFLLPMNHKVWARVEAGPAQGLWFELNPRTGQNFVRGNAEVAVQAALSERLRPGMVFYDLGANIGLFTLMAARIIAERGKVFSFEPDPENAARLRRNIAHNQFQNVTVIEAGVWSSSGNLDFVRDGASSPDRGWGTFVPKNNQRQGASIPCVSLDDFCLTAPPPDAIKCDVEGAEIEALRGAANVLQSRHPWIVCEMHSPANNQAAREFLAALGYIFQTLDANHVLAALPSAPPRSK